MMYAVVRVRTQFSQGFHPFTLMTQDLCSFACGLRTSCCNCMDLVALRSKAIVLHGRQRINAIFVGFYCFFQRYAKSLLHQFFIKTQNERKVMGAFKNMITEREEMHYQIYGEEDIEYFVQHEADLISKESFGKSFSELDSHQQKEVMLDAENRVLGV